MTTDSGMGSYDVTPDATRRVVLQLTERVSILESQLSNMRDCMRERMNATQEQHEACEDIKAGGTD